jgi:nucleoside 2-deoxyribosyltransferase
LPKGNDALSPPLKIYFAGPDVFRPDAAAQQRRLQHFCQKQNVIGLLPTDAIAVPDDADPEEAAKAIFEANIVLIDTCHAMVANMTPFRGPNMDVGTAFEIGYAAAQGKVIVGYTADNRDYIQKVAEHFEGDLREQNGQWRDRKGDQVENFGLPENLMVANAVLDVVDDVHAAIRLLLTMQQESPYSFEPGHRE